MLISYQLAVTDMPPRLIGTDDSILYGELISGFAQSLGGHCQQSFSCGGSSLSQTSGVEVGRSRLTSRSSSLVRCHVSITLTQMHPFQLYTQLFGHQLGLSSQHALTKVALSGVSSDRAITANGDPGIEFRRIDVRRMSIEWTLRMGQRSGD